MRRNILSVFFLVSWFAVGIMASASLLGQGFPVVESDDFSAEQFEQLLFDLPDVRFEKLDDQDDFHVYQLNVKQLVDHNDPSKGHFYQQVLLFHRSFDRPMLMNTNGYNLETGRVELVEMLETNFISVEHRFFGPSTPKDKDWGFLTIEQAAADYHHIRSILGKLYQEKWISTGISKGGETCTYYKYFYPDDVAFSVPYVAPFPDGLKDQRIYEFLDTTGTEEVRNKIFAFQKNVLKNKEKIVPLFRYYLKGKGATFDLIGGPEAALELIVMEYPFSFWQAGQDHEKIPNADATHEELLDHLVDSGDFWYLLDESTENLAAHYYQHATQYGYYGYRPKRFGDLITKWDGEPSACFFPYEHEVKFDPSVRTKIIEWMKTDAKNIVFIYGAIDTWTVCQALLGDNEHVHKFIFEGKHHGNARIKNVDDELQNEILDLIRAGIGEVEKED